MALGIGEYTLAGYGYGLTGIRITSFIRSEVGNGAPILGGKDGCNK